MGFSLDLIISDENHYHEFICAICAQLAEPPSLTSCNHVFCSGCIERWRQVQRTETGTDPTCPKCMQTLADGSVVDLATGSPLAARIFGRVRCRCPIANCPWVGDFDGLQAHLTNSAEHTGSLDGTASVHEYCDSRVTATTAFSAGDHAVYTHASGQRETVIILKVHSADEGGGYTIKLMGEGGHERSTVAERLEPLPQLPRVPLQPTATLPSDAAGAHVSADSTHVSANTTYAPASMAAAESSSFTSSATSLPSPSSVSSSSSSSSTRATVSETMRTATGLKEQGNHKFSLGQFGEAMALYSRAITICRSGAEGAHSKDPIVAALFSNRAACNFRLERYKAVIADCEAALAIDHLHVKSHVRLTKALCEMGEFKKAGLHLRGTAAVEAATQGGTGAAKKAATELRAARRTTEALCAVVERGLAALARGANTEARAAFGEGLRLGCKAPCLVLWAAEAELAMGTVDRALRVTRQAVRQDAADPAALALHGRALFAAGELLQAAKCLREALRRDPDAAPAQRALKMCLHTSRSAEAARAAHRQRSFADAVEHYSKALEAACTLPEAAPLIVTLHAERGAARLRKGDIDACLADCAAAIAVHEDHRAAWLTRCEALEKKDNLDAALEGLKALQQRNAGDKVIEHRIEQVEKEQRRRKRPNYYEALGVPSVASEPEIKHAYKQRALECHPDRHSTAPAAQRAEAERQFKLLGEALELLGDPMKRKLYDEGYDKAAIEERIEAANRAAREGPHRHRH